MFPTLKKIFSKVCLILSFRQTRSYSVCSCENGSCWKYQGEYTGLSLWRLVYKGVAFIPSVFDKRKSKREKNHSHWELSVEEWLG